MSNIDCLLTQGFSVGCRSNSGGIVRVYLGNHESLEYTKDSDGIVTAIAGNSPTFELHEYFLQKNISSLTEEITMDPANETVVYTPTINIVINKLTTEMRNELALIAKSLMIAIVEDLNGKYWLVGSKRGLDLSTATRMTGAAIGDRNGTDFSIVGSESEPFIEVTKAAFESFIGI